MGDAPNEQTADPGADLAAGTDVGGYVIDGKIGEGGMGVVYGAKQPRIGKRVAIKIVGRAFCGDPAVVARFEQEARVVNEIKHPNIVDVFQFGELPDKRSYFVMEWLDGEPLTARIDRGAIPTAEAIEILDVICDALQAAHEHNVIHRDLKSDNVFLLTSRGKRTVKLLDFGLAKLSGRGLEEAPVGATKQGIVVGTPAYMSPEQARSQPVDGRTDVYALGVLAYKMLTGTLPFRGENTMDLIVQQLNAPPPQAIKLAPKTPPVLSKLIVRMMAKAPADRPTLTEIRELFADLTDDHLAARPRRATPPSKRHAKPEASLEAQEPSFGKARLSLAELDQRPDHDRPRSRATAIMLGLVLLVGGAGGSVLLIRSLQNKNATPSAAAGTSSAGSATTAAGSAANTATPEGSPAVGSGSAAAAATIEFEDDTVRAAGSSSGSARKRHNEDEAIDKANEAAEAPPISAPKLGKIFVMLQHASSIEIDGKVVAQSSQGGTYEVPPGEHQVKVSTPDRTPVNRTVNLAPGGSTVIRIADEDGAPAPAPTPVPAPAPPTDPATGSATP